MWTLWMGMGAWAAPPDAGVDLQQALAAYNAHAVHPLPPLDARQRAKLLGGEVVRILSKADDPAQPSAAVGYLVTEAPRPGLWIGSQDPHTQVDPDLTEAVIERLGPDTALWYGHIDLPRPIRDRQWVVESSNNHALATQTDGRCWEHLWQNRPEAVEQVRPMMASGQIGDLGTEHLDSAIVTPVNHGSWAMCTLADDKVLLAYQASSVIGGAIPDWLVMQMVMARLEGALREVETRALTWSPTHYVGEHQALAGGDGAPLPPYR